MVKVVLRDADGNELEREVADQVRIGRAEENDLVLTDGGISRRHARLYLEDGKVWVEDSGSANGTFLDGRRLDSPAIFPAGGKLSIGTYQLSVEGTPDRSSSRPRRRSKGNLPAVAGAPAPRRLTTRMVPQVKLPAAARPALVRAAPPRSSAVPPFTGPVLRGRNGLWANKVFPLQGQSVVGRASEVSICLDDDSVSRRHAQIEVNADGVTIKDLRSANGTLLNGQPLSGPALLRPGDVLQFGVVEMEFDPSDSPSLPAARGGVARTARLIGLAACLVALLAASLYGILARTGTGAGPGDRSDSASASEPLDPASQLEEQISLCRSYASTDQSEPDWEKAEAACNKALDLDPIQPDAAALLRTIKSEQENSSHYLAAARAMDRRRAEEALEEYGRIQPGSYYYFKAKPKVIEVAAEVMRGAGEDCRRYLEEGKAALALPRCERYLSVACQRMPREAINPPPGYRVRVAGTAGRGEWMPKDPMVRRFWEARLKAQPQAAVSWECPRMDILQRAPQGPDVAAQVRARLQQRFPERLISDPLFAYWNGKISEAITALQKLRDQPSRADLHQQVDELRKAMGTVDALMKNGEAALESGDPLRAEPPFREALARDAELMGDLAEKHPSQVRLRMQKDIAASAYSAGKVWADRGDFPKACRIWKMGYGFYRGNADLQRAVGYCSERADQELVKLTRCSDIHKVAALAVDGDGVKDRLEEKRLKLHCP